MRQPGMVATTLFSHSVPCSRTTFLSLNCWLAAPTEVNLSSTALMSAFIASSWNTARPMVAAWSFHGSKNASPPDCGMVGAIADSFW